MKNSSKFSCVLSVVLGLAVAVPFEVHAQAQPSRPGAGGAVAVGRATSFKAVTDQLEPGGTLYGYLSVSKWLAGLSAKVKEGRALVSQWHDVPSDVTNAVLPGLELLEGLIQASGVERLDGIGVSSVPVDTNLHRVKWVLHAGPQGRDGFLWSMFGRSAHGIEALDYLPANTALATFGDLHFKAFWQALEEQARRSAFAPAKEWITSWAASFEKATGLQWSDTLDSLGGELGLALTLDEERKVQVPVDRNTIEVPMPGLMLAIKVKNDLLYDRLVRDLVGNPNVTVTNEPGLKMVSMPVPLPFDMPLQLVVARWRDSLLVCSSEALVRTAQAVREGRRPGLRSRPEFARLAGLVPTNGNQFAYVSPLLNATILDIQRKALAGASMPKELREFVENLFELGGTTTALSVSGQSEVGWQTVTVGTQDGAQSVVVLPAVAAGAVAAGVALPALAKAKTRAQMINSVTQLKQIGLAARIYANDHDDTFPQADRWCDVLTKDGLVPAKVLKSPGDPSAARCSYAMNAKLSGMQDGAVNPQTVLFFEAAGGWNQSGGPEMMLSTPRFGETYVVGFADGSVQQISRSRVKTLRWDP